MISKSYRDNPFHNFSHAVSVTQMMYLFLNHIKVDNKLKDEEIFSVLLSSLCHDIDHPGLSNGFHIKHRTSLSLTYNDASPLENHHSSCAWSLLFSSGLFYDLTPSFLTNLREIMIHSILATDMAMHFTILNNFATKVSTNSFSWLDRNDRISFLSMLVKCADISNETRPWVVSKKWADVLLDEFFHQADLEKQRGLPVTPFMDREKVEQAQTQIGFIDNILIPTFTTVAKIVPEIEICIDKMKVNRQRWIEIKNGFIIQN